MKFKKTPNTIEAELAAAMLKTIAIFPGLLNDDEVGGADLVDCLAYKISNLSPESLAEIRNYFGCENG